MYDQMEDKRMKRTITNKSGVTLHGLKPGGELSIETDSDGTPFAKNWRRRVVDGRIDGAIVLTEIKQMKKEYEDGISNE